MDRREGARTHSDDPELGKMGADRVYHASLLLNEQMARPVEHQAGLLLGCLRLHEPHVRPRHCLADRLGVGGIVLLPLDVELHVGRRHQSHRMAQRLELARPMMRRGAGLDPYEAGRQLLEERQHMAPPQLAADQHIARRIDAVDLKHRFGDVETDGGDRFQAWLPES